MGKTNKANRTKGNMRPSSSGHSAELLGPSSGFIGFAALGGKEGSFVPVTGDTTDTSVDSDFRMVMRKMLKRDAVTRLKAVQEFGDYCVEKEKDIVKNVLPFWPRLFNRLVMDLDRRVREATHVANGKLLAKVGREVAPHLRNIMAVWLLGQCDLHAPASSAAKDTFAQTFPQETKRGEAVLFCRGEVLAHFKDNLFEQTAKSMSEPNPTSPEDMESKYHLVIGATLQALKLFLCLTRKTVTDDNNIEQDMRAIVQDGKFWKYAKSKEPQIRAAWFSLISSLCQICSSAFEGTEKKLATTIFGQLSESDPVVAPSVWESALSIVMNREDCWQMINIGSVALPQLWLLLKGGGKGNASALFPCLLPLVSRLPKETAHSEAFLKQFFSCLAHSLMLDSVKLSTSECDAILSAFFECLQFMCCTRLSEKEGVPLLQEIISNEIIPLLSVSLHTEEGTHLAVSRLYPLLSSLLLRAEQKKMSSVVNGFWQQALPVACKAFEECKEKTTAFLGYFFHSMVQWTADGKKEKKVVRFKDEEIEEVSTDNVQPSDKLANPNQLSEKDPATIGKASPVSDRLSNQRLEDGSASLPHIATFCCRLCREIEAKGCPLGLLILLEEILTSANSKSLLVELTNKLSKEGSCETGSVSSFLHEVLLKWLWKVREDEKCVSILLNIVFLSCSFLTSEDAIRVLDGCCKVQVCLVEHVLCKGLQLCRGAPFFREWLASSRCSSQVIRMLRGLVVGKAFFSDVVRPSDMEGCKRTLSLCLLDTDTELLIDDASFQDILNFLYDLSVQLFAAKFVEKNSKLALNFIHDVSCAVLKNYKRCWKFDATEKLVYLIFSTCLNDVLLFKNSDDVLQTLFRLLDTSVYSYCQAKDEVTSESSLILRMAKELNCILHSLNNPKNASHAKEHCLFLPSSVLKVLEQQDSARATFVCHKLMEAILPSPETWNKLTEGLAVNTLPFFLESKIFCPISLEDQFFYPEDNVLRITLASEVISEILCSDNLKFVGDDVVVHARQLVWCLAFCRGTRKRLEVSEESSSKRLEESCLKLLSLMQPDEIETLKRAIFDLSLKDASWGVCLLILGQLLPCGLQSLAEEQFQISSDLDMVEGVPKYMTRQVLIPYLSTEKKQMYFEELLLELQNIKEDIKDLEDKNLCGKMGEVCIYLRDSEIQLTPEMRTSIGIVFRNISPCLKESEKGDTSAMYHMQAEAIFGVFCFAANREFVDSEVWKFFVEKLSTLLDRSCRQTLDCPRSLLFLNRTLRLFHAMSHFIMGTMQVTQDTLLLWRPELLSEKLCRRIIQLYLHVSMQDKAAFEPGASDVVLSLVVECVRFVPDQFTLHSLFYSLDSDDTLRRTVDLLSSSVRQFQLASHNLLIKVMPNLPDCLRAYLNPTDDDSDDDEKKEEYEKIPEKLSPIVRGLRFLSEVVDSMLMDVKIGDACTVVPHTDSYRISLAYLLGWTHLLEFIAASPSQVRHGYATDLTERGLLPSLFFNAFRMMPENPVLLLKRQGVGTPKKEDLKRLFLKPPQLNTGFPCSEEVESVACYVFAKALSKVPASIRSWWNNLDRKSADIVNNFTSKYVSAHICVAEIQSVQEHEKQFENLIVQARPGSREVIATYVVDECPMELCVSLPFNHPLGPITAEKRGKGGQAVGEAEWRNWLMQLTTLLTHQNGSIQEGLCVWKKNLDKKFEGVEECTICYMILHSATLKLPRLSCHVCRKKFHSACLYKWFRTSNNSTCPLCRNEFTM